jgi:dTDP-4-dehydrorhamnose 3,5-epimerase
MLEGVKVWPCQRHADDRGYLTEIAKASTLADFTWAQTNFTVAHAGVIKAFHWHKHQSDLWYCVSGNIQTVLYDRRVDSPTHGQTQVVVQGEHNSVAVLIPPGVAHGYRVLGSSPAGLVYHVTREYDPANPDEERIAHDDPTIGFDWNTKAR